MALQDDLFKSIDTIVQSRIANLPYDKTLECEITNTDNANSGIYRVRHQAAIFDAFSTSTTFKKGDIVYVAVPQSDFTQNKIILAKKKTEETQIVKTLPFPSFVKGSNLFSQTQNNAEYSIVVNNGNQTGTQFNFVKFEGEELIAGYTKLGIKMAVNADIQAPLVSGDYGLRILLYGYDQSKTLLKKDNAVSQVREAGRLINNTEIYSKKEDMVLTNPYNTHGYQNQQKVIDINNYVIDSIVIQLWQDNNFKDALGNSVQDQRIYFNNLQLYLGYDESEFKDSNTKLIIYSYDGLLYDSTNEHSKKEIYSRIITRNPNNNTYTESNNFFQPTWQYIWENYNPTLDLISSYSNKIGFQRINFTDVSIKYKELTLDNQQEQSLTTGYTRNGYTFILRDGVSNEHNYISNTLWFTNKLYAGITVEELSEESVTSYFTADENGYVYLGNSSSTNTVPLIIQNISLRGVLTIVDGELYFQVEAEDGQPITLLSIKSDGSGIYLGSSSGFTPDGKIADNFKAIKKAIEDLGGSYNIIN